MIFVGKAEGSLHGYSDFAWDLAANFLNINICNKRMVIVAVILLMLNKVK